MFKTIRFRLMLIAAVPLLFALVLSFRSLKTAYDDLNQMSELEHLMKLANHVSEHVHESQKERGATGVFMGSGGTKFASELAEQRATADTRRTALKEFLVTFDASVYGDKFEKDLTTAVTEMELIPEYREKITALSIPTKKALGFYTAHNAAMLNLVTMVSKLCNDPELARTAAAQGNFLQGKERAGIERAVMSKTFAADRFESGVLRKFGTLVSEQDTYFNGFRELAADDKIALYDEKLSGAVVEEVQRLRTIAFKKGEVQTDGFGIDAGDWFTAITKKINLMKEVDDHLAEGLRATAARERGAMESLLKVSTDISALVHETQKERGLTAGHLSSDRELFTEELQAQRRLTDVTKQKVMQSVGSLNRATLGKELIDDLDHAVAMLEEIEEHRAMVDDESISSSAALGYYTQHNSRMLEVIAQTANSTTDAEVRTAVIAYAYLLEGKERAGLERAVLSKAFVTDKLEGEALTLFASLVAKQEAYFDAFRALALPKHVALYEQKMSAPIVAEIRRLRTIAFQGGPEGSDGFGIDAEDWFAAKTKEIGLLKDVEGRMADSLAATAARKFSGLESLLKLSTDISALVHETQKERGLTGAYVGSGRQKFSSELAAQRALTDARRKKLDLAMSQLVRSDLDKEFATALDLAIVKLSKLDAHRTKVSDGTVSGSEAIGFYSKHNALMLDAIFAVADSVDNGEVRTNVFAYVNLLQGKERAGIERAVMSKTFAADCFESGTLKEFGNLVSEQNTYFDSFRKLATPQQVAFYDKKVSGPVVDDVQRMRDVAFKMGSVDLDGFGVDATHWFDQMTQKINAMKEVEDELSASLLSSVATSRAASRWSLILITTISTVVLLGVSALVYVITRGITKALQESVQFAEKIAGGDLTNRLDSTREDEIGKLMNALSTMGGESS